MRNKRKITRISVRATEELKEVLARITAKENMSQANLIEHLLRSYESRYTPITGKGVKEKI